jgi:hypothetical protein
MRKWGAVAVLLWVPLMPVAAVHAQYEGSDARYAEQRRQERSKFRWVKLAVGGAVLVIAGGAWVFRKATGKA